MEGVRVLVLAGSVREGSFNRRLAARAAAALRERGAKVTELAPAELVLPLYDANLEANAGVPAAAHALHEQFRTHAGIFLASPEYNASVPPLVANAIAWVSRVSADGGIPAAFGRPVFALGSASPGGFGGYRGAMALRQLLELGLGARVLPQMVSVPRAHEAFAADGSFVAPAAQKQLDGVVGKLLEALATRA